MATWMKRTFDAEGVTEYPAGPRLTELSRRFRSSGAVVLCVDVSFSMRGTPLREAQRGGNGFIDDAVDGGYQLGVILWADQVEDFAEPTTDASRARAVLNAAEVSGTTELTPALKLAEKLLSSTRTDDQVCVVFTDGALGDSREAKKAADRMREQGIRILTIGLGRTAARGLEAIAGAGGTETREATAGSLADDLRGMATGLRTRRKR